MRRLRRQEANAELNITAFLNLMVILVPFLLITAVFSRMTILELQLPDNADATNEDKPPEFQLSITIRPQQIDVSDKPGRILRIIKQKEGKHDYAALSELLVKIKSRFPDELAASILSEADTSYDTLIQVMDTVRVYHQNIDGEQIPTELFPEVALGEARPLNPSGDNQ